MRALKRPGVMVLILSIMYRYIFVVSDEMMRMKMARDSRNFGGHRLWQWRTLGNMVGTLFLRTYERGERIYSAMVARGFDGQARILEQLRFQTEDAFFAAGCGIILVLIGLGNLVL
jgi:cobalt/nickel transport system permease protein